MDPVVPNRVAPAAGGAAWDQDGAADGPGLLASIARYKYAVAAFVVICAGLVYLVSSRRPPVYEATATIFLLDTADAGRQELNVQQEASRLQSPSVFKRAEETLGEPVDSVVVEPDTTVGVIEVTASSRDAEHAATVATTVARAYEEIRQRDVADRIEAANKILKTQGEDLTKQINRLEDRIADRPDDEGAARQLDTARAQLLALQARVSEMSVDASLNGAGIDDIEDAVTPSTPASPQPERDAAIAAAVALLLGATVAFWRAGISAKAGIDPGLLLGAPLLAQIPDFRLSSGTNSLSDLLLEPEATEAYQFLLSSVEFALGPDGAHSVLVSSASPGEGKSLTALHLARALAVQGRDVTLVDTDIRARGLTGLLKASDQPGLVALAEGAPLDSVTRQYRVSDSVRLSVVPAGAPPEHVTGLLATAKYRRAIAAIVAASDITIIDSAPLLTVADASVVATLADGILLVIDARAPEWELRRLRERLRLISTPLLGYVINRAPDVKAPPSYGPAEPATNPWVRGFDLWRRRRGRSLPVSPVPTAERD